MGGLWLCCDGDDHDSGCLENKPTGEWIEGWSLAFSSSVDVCPLEELSTSETPESAGLGGNEPEIIGRTSGAHYTIAENTEYVVEFWFSEQYCKYQI